MTPGVRDPLCLPGGLTLLAPAGGTDADLAEPRQLDDRRTPGPGHAGERAPGRGTIGVTDGEYGGTYDAWAIGIEALAPALTATIGIEALAPALAATMGIEALAPALAATIGIEALAPALAATIGIDVLAPTLAAI